MTQISQACPLCGSFDTKEELWAEDPHYGISGRHRLLKCNQCLLLFLYPVYSDEELKALYPADYYAYHPEVQIGHLKSFVKKILGYWQGTKDPDFKAPGKFLDVGCGAGAFLKTMRDRGWLVQGVEVNERAVQRARDHGLDVFCGSLEEAMLPPESFDYIRASHSFEHMTRPHETLEEMHRLLKPDGKLLIAVPNYDSFPARAFKESWYHLCPPVHAFQYSVSNLTDLLAMHNLTVTRVVFNSHYAGLLGSLQIWLNRNTARRSFEGRLFNNRPLRVFSGWIQKVLDAAGTGDMIEITAVKEHERVGVQAA